MFTVTLTKNEVLMCKMIANMRCIANDAAEIMERKRTSESGIDINEDGVFAEYAFCKQMNLHMSIDTTPRSGGYDCVMQGYRVDVKSTRVQQGRLISTTKINPDVDIYVLAILEEDDTIFFPGYATKKLLISDENLLNLGYGNSYVLPVDKLYRWKKLDFRDKKND